MSALRQMAAVSRCAPVLFLLALIPAAAQTTPLAPTNHPGEATNLTLEQPQTPTNHAQIMAMFEHAEKVRAASIEGRRLICGKILHILPEGLVIESGYTNLLREPLTKSWLAPATVQASRAPNMLEETRPGAICFGMVFLTDTPKKKNLNPKPYDYVIIQGYPTGQFTYKSLGTIERTVRKFSADLGTAVRANLQAEDKPLPPPNASEHQ
jgi:hypothetical protein